MTNLKYIFYYEISIKSSQNQNKNSVFYDSLSYDCTIILKFFKNKFPILSSIFFSNESLIENILDNLDQVEIDTCYENYIKFNSNFENSDKNKSLDKERIHFKTKIEILNILSFLVNSYSENDLISQEIIKFIIDLFDCLINKSEEPLIIDHIQSLFMLIVNIYKSSTNEKYESTPIKLVFQNLIKHIVNKILSPNQNVPKKLYLNYLQEFKNLVVDKEISQTIIYSVKELVYQNVDNQSFRNPITMYSLLT